MDNMVVYALAAAVIVLGAAASVTQDADQCVGGAGTFVRQAKFTSSVRVILVVEDNSQYATVQHWLPALISSLEEKLLSLGIGTDANLPNKYAVHGYNSRLDPGGEFVKDERGEWFFPARFLARTLSMLNASGVGPADGSWHGYNGLLRALFEFNWQVLSSVAHLMLLVSTEPSPRLQGPQSSLFVASQLALPGWSVSVVSNVTYQCQGAGSPVVGMAASGVAYSLDGSTCAAAAPTASSLRRRGDGTYAANPEEVAFLQKQVAWSLPTPENREQFAAVFAEVTAQRFGARVAECGRVRCSCADGRETCASQSGLSQCRCAATGYYWDEWTGVCSACQLSQWSEWEACSRSCDGDGDGGSGGGVSVRRRTVARRRADNSSAAATCPTLVSQRTCVDTALPPCPPDECQLRTHGCAVMATCNDTDDALGYVCTCLDGYHGNGLNCEEVDECLSSPCLHGGSCTDGIASFSCHCTSLYTGVDCAHAIAVLVPSSESSIGIGEEELSRLQLRSSEGALSSVCAGGFTPEAAAVACRHMGFADAVQMGTLPGQAARDGNAPVVMVTSNECRGNETDLRDCLEVQPMVAMEATELAYRCLTVGLVCRDVTATPTPVTPHTGALAGTVVTDRSNTTVTAMPLDFSQLVLIASVTGLVLLCALLTCCLLAHLRHKSYIGTTAHSQLARASTKKVVAAAAAAADDITSPPPMLPARRSSKYNYSDPPPDMSHRMSHHLSVVIDTPPPSADADEETSPGHHLSIVIDTPPPSADADEETSPPHSQAATPPQLESELEVGTPLSEDLFGDLRAKYSLPRAVVSE